MMKNKPGCHLQRARGAGWALLQALLLTCAYAADPPPAQEGTPQAVDVEVFQGAKPLTAPDESAYPSREKYDNKEGWVLINLMIDPQGKPHDATVVDSTGNPAFEEAALKAVHKMSFQPARLGKTPVDSSLTFKMQFKQNWAVQGAFPSFATAFGRFQKAIAARDRVAADAELPNLLVRTLYEDAYRGYGQYLYDHEWGTVEEQLKDLKRAIAGEKSGVYLPQAMFGNLLGAQFALQYNSGDYGGAMNTWDDLSHLAGSPVRDQIEPLAKHLLAVRSSAQSFSQSGKIGPGTSWNGYLFKNHFAVAVASGSVAEIKLRCKKQFIFFKFQPDIRYTVNPGAGQCYIELVGEPGTAFELRQS